MTITEINPARKSGFPQMELHKDTLIFAWTDTSQPFSKIRTVAVPHKKL